MLTIWNIRCLLIQADDVDIPSVYWTLKRTASSVEHKLPVVCAEVNTVLCSTLESWLKGTTSFSLLSTSVANLRFWHFKMSMSFWMVQGKVIAKRCILYFLGQTNSFTSTNPRFTVWIFWWNMTLIFLHISVWLHWTETLTRDCAILHHNLSQKTCTLGHWRTNFVTVLGNSLSFIK